MDTFSNIQSNQVSLPQKKSWSTEVVSYLRHQPGVSNCKSRELREENDLTVRRNLMNKEKEATSQPPLWALPMSTFGKQMKSRDRSPVTDSQGPYVQAGVPGMKMVTIFILFLFLYLFSSVYLLNSLVDHLCKLPTFLTWIKGKGFGFLQ